MKISMAGRSRHAMAADPVSPEVAPMIVMRSPRRLKTSSNRRPST